MALTITTVLQPQGPATAIELTDAEVAELGAGKRAAVLVVTSDSGQCGGYNSNILREAERSV